MHEGMHELERLDTISEGELTALLAVYTLRRERDELHEQLSNATKLVALRDMTISVKQAKLRKCQQVLAELLALCVSEDDRSAPAAAARVLLDELS